MSWADHIECVRKKVNQRLDVLRRIKLFLPFYARKLFVSTMVLPFLDITTNLSAHNYQTRHANDLSVNRSWCGEGQLRSSYFLFKEWNKIPVNIRNSESVGIFKNYCYHQRVVGLVVFTSRFFKSFFYFSIFFLILLTLTGLV